MPVLTIASSKGGAGKTPVCQVLAVTLAGELRVVALGADPTQALSRWAGSTYEGPTFEVMAADETRLAHLIAAKAETGDLVLVDTAGFGNRTATVAITSADGVLIRSLSGEADVTETEKTVRPVESAARRDIPACVLLNRVRQTTSARHAAAEIKAAGLPRLTAVLSPTCIRRDDLFRPASSNWSVRGRDSRAGRRIARTRLDPGTCITVARRIVTA